MMNELLVTAICSGSMTGPADMCHKTTEAAAKQFGIHQTVSVAEDKGKALSSAKTREVFGGTGFDVLLFGVIVGKVSSGKSATVRTGCGSFCNKITLTGSKKAGSVGFGWDF